MSEAHDGPGAEVTITVDAGEGAAIEGGPGVEVVGGAAAEPIAEAAVEIAQIEADRDVTLAAIHQEGEAEFADRLHSSELEQCRTTIARLEGELEALRNPPPVLEVLIPEPSPEPPASPPEPASESTEGDGPRESPAPLVEPEAAAVVEEPPKPKRPRFRWI